MGKKSAEKSNAALDAQTQIAKTTTDIASDLVKESAPARKYAMNTYMGLAKGNVPGIEKLTAPQTNMAAQQFAMARKSVEQMPPGAARDAAMRDISLQEAATKNQIYSGGVNEALARTAAMGWGGTQAGVGAYGQAGGMYGNVGQTYDQMASAKGGMAGAGAGAAGSVAAAAIAA